MVVTVLPEDTTGAGQEECGGVLLEESPSRKVNTLSEGQHKSNFKQSQRGFFLGAVSNHREASPAHIHCPLAI